MSARVLVVDDIAANVKLLEVLLSAEYFEVVTAFNGQEALEKVQSEQPDIVLLDVMMPGMDGFEVCRRIKAMPDVAHIPVVMVTALDQAEDRVQGLNSGADDFLTKPVDEVSLMARVKSLVRLKLMTDELRMRETTGRQLGLVNDGSAETFASSDQPGHILVVEDRTQAGERLMRALSDTHMVDVEPSPAEALIRARSTQYDLIVVSLSLQDTDGLRLCSQFRSLEQSRHVPLLALVQDGDQKRLVRALELGVNDYLVRPVDKNELTARVRTQIRRKAYADKLRDNYQLSLEMAITDQLTGLYNRRYLVSHLDTLMRNAAEHHKPISFLIMDIDFFKAVNDTHGHAVGDEVLAEAARRIQRNVRGIDLACRYGGEEFVVAMPDTDLSFAYSVAERLRKEVAEEPFKVSTSDGEISITISIGVTSNEGVEDTAEELLKRADEALYQAKRDGRNRVVAAAA